MEKKPDKTDSGGPPGWVLASQWGMNLVVLTCFLGYGGFWIGDRLENKALSLFLTLIGIIGGFALGVYRMVKASEELKKNKVIEPSDKS